VCQKTIALKLIKGALEQINFALQLLEGIEKPVSYLLEKVSEISEKVENISATDAATDAATDVKTKDDAIGKDHVSDVEEEIIHTLHQEEKPVRKIIEEEFKIVLPKKSKNKKMASNIMNIPALEKDKSEEFPSLGSSFTPIK
jgi:hypothetical protein